MYKFLSLLFILLGYSHVFSQINNEDESNDISHAISIGWSNPISSISTIFDSNKEEKFGLLIDYQITISENNFYRVHSKFSPSYKNPMLSLNNFLISINKGKWLMDKRNSKIGHGIGPYFRCNIYRGQAVAGTQAFWSSDYFGMGLEYLIFLCSNIFVFDKQFIWFLILSSNMYSIRALVIKSSPKLPLPICPISKIFIYICFWFIVLICYS